MPFQIPNSVIRDVKIRVAVVVEVEPGGAGAPSDVVQSALSRAIRHRAVTVIDVETERIINAGQVQVRKTIAIKVGRRYSSGVSAERNASQRGDVAERFPALALEN